MHWHENFRPGKWSLLGFNQGPKPWIAGANENEDKNFPFDTNPANSPILNQNQTALSVIATKEIGFELKNYAGSKTYAGGLAYDKKNDEFALKGQRLSLHTTRAKKNYVLSLAKDPDSRYFYMLTVAAKKAPSVILLKFDSKDNKISEETILEFDKGLQLKENTKVNSFYITGADIANGKMLAISKNYNALLVIDLASKTITNAYTLPNIGDISDIAIKADELYILTREGGKDKIVVVENPVK